MRSSEAAANRSTKRACDTDSSCHAPAGSERSRNSARPTNAAKSDTDMPASCASAGVGHSDTHHRRANAASRSGARARAARVISDGSTPDNARVFSGACIVIDASVPSASASSRGANPSRCTSRAAVQNPSSCPGNATRSSGHASRSNKARCRASRAGEASVVERTTTCWPARTSRQ